MSLSLATYLSEAEKSRLALSLAEKLDERQIPAVLADLVVQLEPTAIDQIYDSILHFVLAASADESRFEDATAFIRVLPKLSAPVVDSIVQRLRSHCSKYNFITGFDKLVESQSAGTVSEDDTDTLGSQTRKDLLGIFGFLTQIYTSSIKHDSWDTADQLLCLFLGHRDDQVSLECSKLLRWRTDHIVSQCVSDSAKYYWDIVFQLEKSSESKRHRSNAFVMWLRMLNSGADFKNDGFFQQQLISHEFYWRILQSGLGGSSHEVRKYCLSILQLSLKAINCSFSNSIISWDLANEKQLLQEWSRFTTLYEVLGVDTSLHQTQAAVHDILAIITPDSLVHASWGFCLLSTGFQASMDSVRKYSAHILLSIEPQNLHLLQHGLQYLENYFLPYLMLSRHLAVRPKSETSNEMHCAYGDQYSNFLSSVLTHLKDEEECGKVTNSILAVLAEAREAFDAVKIYTMFGIVQGLGSRRVLQYGVHDKFLLQLFEDFSEGELFKRTMQTLNLRLLLNFRLTSLAQFGDLVSKFNSFNGYKIFVENLADICTYLKDSGFERDQVSSYLESTSSVEEQVVFTRILLESQTDNINTSSQLVFAKLLESGLSMESSWFKTKIEDVFKNATMGTVSEDVYHILSQCQLAQLPELNLEELWTNVVDGVLSDDYGILTLTHARLQFLCNCLQNGGSLDIDFDTLLSLHPTICRNSAACAKSVTNFYKLKENMFGEYYRLLSIFVHKHGINSDQFKSIAKVLPQESTHFVTATSIANIFKIALSSQVDSQSCEILAETLASIITELGSGNLKLAEKGMHWALIEALFHEHLLKASITNSVVNDHIAAATSVLIASSFGRRGIMTKLFRLLATFQVQHPTSFEQLPFLPRFLIDSMIQRELKSSAFRLEEIIGELYDVKVASGPKSNLYYEVYGESEVAYKVILAAMLNSIKSSSCAQAIFAAIFDKDDSYHLFNIVKAMDGEEERVRVQLAKIIVSIMDVAAEDSTKKLNYERFEYFVENDPSPLVRVYFEWALACHLLRYPELSDGIFVKLASSLDNHELKPILVTSYERVLFLMIQAMEKETKTKYLTKLITIIVPAASTNKAVTRHFSMSLAMSIFSEIEKHSLDIDVHLRTVIDNMNRSALATDAFGQYRSGDACLWNIIGDLDLVHISGGLLLRLFDRDVDFITEEEFEQHLTEAQVSKLTHPIGKNRKDLWVRKLKANTVAIQESSGSAVSALQTKSGAWSTVMDVDEKSRVSDIKRSDLIVVGSLVDKAPNLGGICRLCDVLGAGLLTLHDLAVKKHQSFKSVAVTADHWMPMIEVKPQEIVSYLREKKRAGYTLIGLEQTDKSVELNSDLKFPQKSLILLGREKEGIPGELLAELDLCVEIKQVGVVRSMNIQTATAVIVHAYASQNC